MTSLRSTITGAFLLFFSALVHAGEKNVPELTNENILILLMFATVIALIIGFFFYLAATDPDKKKNKPTGQ